MIGAEAFDILGKTGTPLTAEKTFAAGGKVELQLESGNYDVHAATGNRGTFSPRSACLVA